MGEQVPSTLAAPLKCLVHGKPLALPAIADLLNYDKREFRAVNDSEHIQVFETCLAYV